MLRAIREHAQGWIAWVIVGLIILTFALFGIDQYAKGEKTVVVATVNGEEISANQFSNLYSRQKNRLEQQFGEMYDQVVKDEQLREEVMQSLVESEVIRQWSAKHDLRVSDQQLAMTIHSATVFHKDGQFDQANYEDILMRNGLSVARFEFEQRQFLIENQMRQITQASAVAMPFQVQKLLALQTQQRQFNYLQVEQTPFLATVEVSDEQVNAFYQENQTDFIAPQQVSLDYIELSQEALANNVEVTPEILLAHYESNESSFVLPEKRRASHILIATQEGNEASAKEALDKITDLKEQIAKGADFAELAKQHSQDPGSAKMGGDLGLFQQGMMVPEFDEAVFNLQKDQVSEPIKTDFGYHLIKVVHIEPKETQAFESVKAEVETAYREQQADKQYFDVLEKMSTAAYEQSDSLMPAADAAGLTIQTTSLFQRQGGETPLTSNSKVQAAAFSEDVLKSRLNSSVIELSPKSAVVIRVNQFVAERQKPLDEVKEVIVAELKRTKATQAAADLAEELLAKVQSGVDPKSLQGPGVEWTMVTWVGQDNRSVAPQITAEVFKMPKPSAEQSTFKTLQLMTGDAVVLALMGVKQSEEAIPDEQVKQMKDTLQGVYATAEVDARIKALVAEAKVVKKAVYQTLK